jgi:hypothetical protein
MSDVGVLDPDQDAARNPGGARRGNGKAPDSWSGAREVRRCRAYRGVEAEPFQISHRVASGEYDNRAAEIRSDAAGVLVAAPGDPYRVVKYRIATWVAGVLDLDQVGGK